MSKMCVPDYTRCFIGCLFLFMLCLLQMYVIILNLQNLLFTLLYIRVRASEAERSKLKWENLKVESGNLVFRFHLSPFRFYLF